MRKTASLTLSVVALVASVCMPLAANAQYYYGSYGPSFYIQPFFGGYYPPPMYQSAIPFENPNNPFYTGSRYYPNTYSNYASPAVAYYPSYYNYNYNMPQYPQYGGYNYMYNYSPYMRY